MHPSEKTLVEEGNLTASKQDGTSSSLPVLISNQTIAPVEQAVSAVETKTITISQQVLTSSSTTIRMASQTSSSPVASEAPDEHSRTRDVIVIGAGLSGKLTLKHQSQPKVFEFVYTFLIHAAPPRTTRAKPAVRSLVKLF